jgi:hypothetical protein
MHGKTTILQASFKLKLVVFDGYINKKYYVLDVLNLFMWTTDFCVSTLLL